MSTGAPVFASWKIHHRHNMLIWPSAQRCKYQSIVWSHLVPSLKQKKKKAVIQNKHLDNMEIERSEGWLVNRCSHPHQIPLVFFLVHPLQKVVFLCRLPAGLDWSTGVPRPHGSAAAAPESGCHEQPTRSSGAKCDGLLPNDVFLSGACPQLGNRGLWSTDGTGHRHCQWLALRRGYNRKARKWEMHTSTITVACGCPAECGSI